MFRVWIVKSTYENSSRGDKIEIHCHVCFFPHLLISTTAMDVVPVTLMFILRDWYWMQSFQSWLRNESDGNRWILIRKLLQFHFNPFKPSSSALSWLIWSIYSPLCLKTHQTILHSHIFRKCALYLLAQIAPHSSLSLLRIQMKFCRNLMLKLRKSRQFYLKTSPAPFVEQ